MKNGFLRKRKEAFLMYFELLFRDVSGETKEIHEYSQSGLPISGPGDERGISRI
jgi:hypothetical protein